MSQRDLGRRVARVLLAANDRHFAIARGKSEIHCHGAKAFAAVPEFADGTGVRASLAPAHRPLPTLTDAAEREIANDFQSQLLRFRMVNHRRVCDAKVDTREFRSRDARGSPCLACAHVRLSGFAEIGDHLPLATEPRNPRRSAIQRPLRGRGRRIFFCHKPDTHQFFIGDLAEIVNTLLKGRHEDRVLSDKKVGLLLRGLGVHAERVVQGYKLSSRTQYASKFMRLPVHIAVLSGTRWHRPVPPYSRRKRRRERQIRDGRRACMYVNLFWEKYIWNYFQRRRSPCRTIETVQTGLRRCLKNWPTWEARLTFQAADTEDEAPDIEIEQAGHLSSKHL